MAKAQGRGSAEWMVVGVLVVAMHCCSLLASAATWTVGGSEGWGIGPNYTTWAAGQSYTTGDVLFFPYAKDAHNVVEVNKADFDACSNTSAIATYADGNTNVTLNTTGTLYFLCSFPSHCTLGMKLAVTVGAGTTPAPAPSTSVGTPAPAPAPAPATTSILAPATTPTSASTPTPVPSPASVGTPSTAPVPSPASVETPTSTPTPTESAPTLSSPPASVGTPTGSAPPPSPAPSLPSSTSLGAALLCLSAALLTF